jgi:DNA primase
MGTSLTTGQASLLRRFTRRIVLAYDGDNAGRNATLRAAPILLSAGLHVEALDLQGSKDPDTLVQERGVDGFLDVLSHAIDIFEFGLREWARDASSLTGREKSERVEQFMPLLSAAGHGAAVDGREIRPDGGDPREADGGAARASEGGLLRGRCKQNNIFYHKK